MYEWSIFTHFEKKNVIADYNMHHEESSFEAEN